MSYHLKPHREHLNGKKTINCWGIIQIWHSSFSYKTMYSKKSCKGATVALLNHVCTNSSFMPLISCLLFLWFPPSLWNHTVVWNNTSTVVGQSHPLSTHIKEVTMLPPDSPDATVNAAGVNPKNVKYLNQIVWELMQGLTWAATKHHRNTTQSTHRYSVWMSCFIFFFTLSILEINMFPIDVCSPVASFLWLISKWMPL